MPRVLVLSVCLFASCEATRSLVVVSVPPSVPLSEVAAQFSDATGQPRVTVPADLATVSGGHLAWLSMADEEGLSVQMPDFQFRLERPYGEGKWTVAVLGQSATGSKASKQWPQKLRLGRMYTAFPASVKSGCDVSAIMHVVSVGCKIDCTVTSAVCDGVVEMPWSDIVHGGSIEVRANAGGVAYWGRLLPATVMHMLECSPDDATVDLVLLMEAINR